MTRKYALRLALSATEGLRIGPCPKIEAAERTKPRTTLAVLIEANTKAQLDPEIAA
jgi:hypothetical protein